jgi:putative transposase
VAVAVATSDGELIDRAFVTQGERRRALALQRKLSRAAKGSANRNKTRAALVELRARERRRRQDFCAKTAHQLAHAKPRSTDGLGFSRGVGMKKVPSELG